MNWVFPPSITRMHIVTAQSLISASLPDIFFAVAAESLSPSTLTKSHFANKQTLVLIHVCVVGRALSRGNNHQGEDEEQSNGVFDGIRTKRMSIQEMNDLPCFEYWETEKRGGVSSSRVTVDCAVCLESFKDGDKCRFLPNCSHSFHVFCIVSWIIKTPICPICRTWVHSQAYINQQVDASENDAIEIV